VLVLTSTAPLAAQETSRPSEDYAFSCAQLLNEYILLVGAMVDIGLTDAAYEALKYYEALRAELSV
jgi:hypothetical protein